MHRTAILFVLMFLSLASISVSQTSIGFKNPENTKPLLDYRLPTWGYRTLSADIGYRGDKNYSDYRHQNSDYSSLYFSLNSNYACYRESEKNILQLGLYFYGHFNREAGEDINEQTDHKHNILEKRFNSNYRVHLGINHYITPNSFLAFATSSDGYYWEQDTETRNTTAGLEVGYARDGALNRDYEADGRIGYGIGRVRNVTPVLRALRLNERLAALQKERALNPDEITEMAQTLARRSGYLSVYERSSKYFWPDVLKPLATQGALSPFDIFYLTEILSENIGARYEGWDASAGIDYQYQWQDQVEYRIKTLGLFLKTRYFHNLSLSQQISFDGDFIWYKPFLNEKNWQPNRLLTLRGDYLWNLADRVLWDSWINFTENFTKREQTQASYKINRGITLETSLSYFIENNLSFSASINLGWVHYDKISSSENEYDLDLGTSMHLTYYFDRSLF